MYKIKWLLLLCGIASFIYGSFAEGVDCSSYEDCSSCAAKSECLWVSNLDCEEECVNINPSTVKCFPGDEDMCLNFLYSPYRKVIDTASSCPTKQYCTLINDIDGSFEDDSK